LVGREEESRLLRSADRTLPFYAMPVIARA
jgi:hypothetical protein